MRRPGHALEAASAALGRERALEETQMATVTTETSTTIQPPMSIAEPSLEAAWRDFNSAFNRMDPKEVASFWDENGTLVGPTGNRGTGRAAVERVYADDLEMFLRGTRSTFTIETTRMLGRDLALVDVEHAIEGARLPDGSKGTMRLHVVALALRKGKDWRWLDARPYAFLPQPSRAAVH